MKTIYDSMQKMKAKKAHNLGKVFRLGVLSGMILAMALPQMAFAQGSGKALEFDGTNDYVSVPDAASLDISSNITIEMWAKKTPTDYGTPTGTAITTCTELQAMNDNLSGDYYLANDIDCSATSGWNSGAGFEPIGTWSSKFTGIFNGQGYKITYLYINRPSTGYVGLFSFNTAESEIKNVGLKDINVTGYDDVGGLIVGNYGTITNCYSTGSVSGNDYVGGLADWNGGTITNCYSTCNVNGSGAFIAGLVDSHIGGTITNCYSTGSVSGNDYVGGLVSFNAATITDSYSTGNVSAIGYCAGGLVEDNYGTITNSYSIGNVSAWDYAGGLVDLNEEGGTITNCYSTGSVSGNDVVGGLVGEDNGGTVTSSYWDTETSGQATSNGGVDKTTAQMKQQVTFIDWDFSAIWAIEEDVTYPFEQWQWGYITSKGRDAYSLQFNRDGSTLYGYISSNEIMASISSSTDWHHIAMTFDGTSQKLYVDGVLKTTTTPGGAIGTNNNTFDIGGAFKGYFGGEIDEVRIWNDMRNQTEIQANMCKKVSTGDNLVSCWRLDGTGSTATDLTGANNGTMTNMDPATDRIWSGAALGDASAYEYSSTFDVNLAHATNGDNITATRTAGTPTGAHVYLVDEAPNVTTPPGGWDKIDPLRYWGVFVVGSATYTVVYNYDGHPGIQTEANLKLARRDNGADGTWTDTDATLDTGVHTLTKTNESGTEYILGSTGGNTLPVVLSFFTAQFLNGVPTLYWKTMSETDNIGWYVYRNTEEDFSTAERITDYLIEGHGTTTKPHYYIYEDVELDGIPGETYWYWIESVTLGGASHRYDPETVVIQGTPEHYDIPTIPKQYGLHQNEPNPLRDGSTEISFRLHNTARVELKIYNIRGELVKNLYKGVAYTDDEVGIPWDGKDENGVVQGTGIYLYQLIVNDKVYETKRLIVIR